MSWDFDRARRELKKARDPLGVGRPIEYETRVIGYGTDLDAGLRKIAIKHFRTNIIMLYPDGSKQFVPWNSQQTKKRLSEYAGVHHFNHTLPKFGSSSPTGFFPWRASAETSQGSAGLSLWVLNNPRARSRCQPPPR